MQVGDNAVIWPYAGLLGQHVLSAECSAYIFIYRYKSWTLEEKNHGHLSYASKTQRGHAIFFYYVRVRKS